MLLIIQLITLRLASSGKLLAIVVADGYHNAHTEEPIRVHDAGWLTHDNDNHNVATGSNYRHNA